jgi:hypothetical protein
MQATKINPQKNLRTATDRYKMLRNALNRFGMPCQE